MTNSPRSGDGSMINPPRPDQATFPSPDGEEHPGWLVAVGWIGAVIFIGFVLLLILGIFLNLFGLVPDAEVAAEPAPTVVVVDRSTPTPLPEPTATPKPRPTSAVDDGMRASAELLPEGVVAGNPTPTPAPTRPTPTPAPTRPPAASTGDLGDAAQMRVLLAGAGVSSDGASDGELEAFVVDICLIAESADGDGDVFASLMLLAAYEAGLSGSDVGSMAGAALVVGCPEQFDALGF